MLHFLKTMMTTVIDRKLYQFIILFIYMCKVGFPCNANGKESSASAGDARDLGSIPGLGDPLGEEMATHSSVVWRMPRTREPGRLQLMGSQRMT